MNADREHRSPESRPARHISERRRLAREENSAEYKARRQAILAAAAGVFRKKGYARTTLAEIAVAADTDRASLYYYAANKEQLFAEVMGKTRYDSAARAEEIAAQPWPADQRLRALITEAMAAFDREYPYLYMWLHEHLEFADPKGPTQEMRRWRSRHFRAFRHVIKDGWGTTFKPLLSPNELALGAIGMIAWSYRWFDPGRSEFSGEEIGAALADIFVSGLTARQRRRPRKQ
ncbi:MAG TPA: TetR/AcrR family transcriptional regulator [Amycolatopsis sp.]|nr:TetR/AcrR family transcriptional regulator [Amycolatopsis sp.]